MARGAATAPAGAVASSGPELMLTGPASGVDRDARAPCEWPTPLVSPDRRRNGRGAYRSEVLNEDLTPAPRASQTVASACARRRSQIIGPTAGASTPPQLPPRRRGPSRRRRACRDREALGRLEGPG